MPPDYAGKKDRDREGHCRHNQNNPLIKGKGEKNFEAKKEDDDMKKILIFAGAGVIALIGALGRLFVRTKEKARGDYYEGV